MAVKIPQTQGYLRENPDFFPDGKTILAHIPDGFDLFYRVIDDAGIYLFSFQLERMEQFEGSDISYGVETLGICESKITIDPSTDDDGNKQAPGGEVYINWLFIEDSYRRKNLHIIYYILYYCIQDIKDVTE